MALEPEEVVDTFQEISEDDEPESKNAAVNRFRQRGALTLAMMAMLLALTSLGGDNATKEANNNNIQAADTFAFYQAKNVRQTQYKIAADEIQDRLDTDPNLTPEQRSRLEKRATSYQETINRYESDPATGEGKKELLEKGNGEVEKRDHALKQDPYFDYAQGLLQIGLVLGSVSLVAFSVWLFRISLLLGTVGVLLMINGFFLLIEIPFIG